MSAAPDTRLARRRATTQRRIDELRASAIAAEACAWWADTQPALRESALAVALRERLVRIDRALVRLRTGLYGVCERCGADLDAARLDEEPESECCEGPRCRALSR
ncbi:MAG: hypothetical protein DCC71_17220 [Proteobacteria bacterium]|nr:MAG: hypothetical protein DCC71_17220 [Pseudomonadota bacterium]